MKLVVSSLDDKETIKCRCKPIIPILESFNWFYSLTFNNLTDLTGSREIVTRGELPLILNETLTQGQFSSGAIFRTPIWPVWSRFSYEYYCILSGKSVCTVCYIYDSLTHFSPVSHFYTPWKRHRNMTLD